MALTRAKYQEMLYRAAVEKGVHVRFGCRITSVEEKERGPLVKLSTGESIEAHVVIGADGKFFSSHPITRKMSSNITCRHQIPRPLSSARW